MVGVAVGEAQAAVHGTGCVVVGIDLQVGRASALLPRLAERLGELLGLRWSNVDFQMGLIRLEDTKNNERRAVPLAGHAFDTDFLLVHASSSFMCEEKLLKNSIAGE